VGACIR